jgi:probable HAF family extracellular repeat protein
VVLSLIASCTACLVGLVVVLGALPPTPAEANTGTATPGHYSIKHLGTLQGELGAYAWDINGSAQVVGHSAGQEYLAYLYENDSITGLGTLGGPASAAQAINDSGQIVGSATTGAYGGTGNSLISHAYLYEAGEMKDLGTPSGSYSAGAMAINNSGQIVGSASVGNNSQAWNAFLYENGEWKNLGTLGGSSSSSFASDINDSGQIVGASNTGTSDENGERVTRAFLYEDGEMKDLGSLGGYISDAQAINDSGQVVGYAYLHNERGTSPIHHAFLYEDGEMKDLGSLSGSYSLAYDINDSGQVVGYDQAGAFLYSEGQMVDLNTRIPADSGWFLTEATAINNEGQIAAHGVRADDPNGTQQAFLLTPQVYNFSGFSPPVDNEPTVNTLSTRTKKGAIPVKFSLSGNYGLNIYAAGYPSSRSITCPNKNSAIVDHVEETVAPISADSGDTTYDPKKDQYTFEWKTQESWKGTCRELNVKLNDGSEHKAIFKFVS